MAPLHKDLGLWSGVGIVVSSMVGAGVFLSAGYMAQDMGPGTILLAWVMGSILALAGAKAYATVVALIPRSGGEYRFLSELWHPFVGHLAGWASLLVGFSAPIALDALAAGAFANTLGLRLDPRISGAGLIGALTLAHAAGRRPSKWVQNAVVSVNAGLLVGFVAVGLLWGRFRWPDWSPPSGSGDFPVGPFMRSLLFIAFAFSGWNAAAYATEEFRTPRRTAPRAMLIGCSLVAALYLLVNWVFVANLTPEQARAVFSYETSRVTLGHLVARELGGAAGGVAMSVLALAVFVSALSAMIFCGPRVYAAMARDGFLPRALEGAADRPPVISVVLQGALAVGLLLTHELRQVLQNVGAILTLFTALTAAALFRVRFGALPGLARPPALSLGAAGLYALGGAFVLYFGFRGQPTLLLWVAGIGVAASAAFVVARRRRRSASGERVA
jgi:APA family basic amino acid/polyamine antiporter